MKFRELNLSEEMQKGIDDLGFEEATPIQAQSIPHILSGRDVIGQAQTGTGKTCAFGIPAIEMLDSEAESIQVMVLCPTRELAIQSSEELKSVTKYKSGIRILPIYGGQPIDRQIRALKNHPQIIIGTPGRVMDHMRRRTLKLANLKMLILDEADEMLNMGFREDIDTILKEISGERQTILFSATMPREILDLTSKYMKNPIFVKMAHKELTVPNTEQYYLEVNAASKTEVLSRIIDANNIKLSLVFCNTKKRVDELAADLQLRGYSAEALHGDLRQEQRDKVMAKFRSGQIDILIATDVAARGIDVDDVEAVFNYDLPSDEEYYVHRIGRTGRAGKAGKAFSFVVGREIYKMKDIQRFTKAPVLLIKAPTLMDVEESKLGKLMETVKQNIAEGQLSKYASYIEKTLEDINSLSEEDSYVTVLDFAAAILKMISEPANSQTARVPEIDDGDTGGSDGFVRLFINIGSKDKIQPGNIVQGIASKTSMPGKLIGAIDIFDEYTFVEVPKEYAHEVLDTVKNYTIRGKKVRMERTNSRPTIKRKHRPINK